MTQVVPEGNLILRTPPTARYDLWRTLVRTMLEEDKHMLIEGEIVPDFPGGTASCEPFTLSSIRSKKVLLCFYA